MNIKRGMTLIELLVSMSIFSVVLLVAVGAFINMNNLRAVALGMRESQQKLRMGIEVISRYSRQAEKVVIDDTTGNCDANDTCDQLAMYFNISGTVYAIKFKVDKNTASTTYQQLLQYDCTAFTAGDCTTWAAPRTLIGGDVKIESSSGFTKNALVLLNDSTTRSVFSPPSVSIKLFGSMTKGNNYYRNNFDINTRVILENIK